MKPILLTLAAAYAAGIAAVAADVTVALDSSSANLAFSASPSPRDLYFVWGASDAGRTTNGWANVQACGQIAAGDTARNGVALPSGYVPSTHAARFVLIDRFDSASYVAEGLVAQWDGIENAGRGVHDASATTWKDLVGSHDITSDQLSFTASCGHFDHSKRVTIPFAEISAASEKTAEIVVRTDTSFKLADNLNARSDLINLCGDGLVSFRGDGYNVIAIFVNPTTRAAFYVANTDSPYDKQSSMLSDQTYSGVYRTDVNASDLRINGDLFVRGTSSYKYTTTSGFSHAETLTLGLGRGPTWYSSVRIYNRALTESERRHNARVDAVRFRGAEPPQAVSALLGTTPTLAPFRLGTWNIGHFSAGTQNSSTIAASAAAEKAVAYNALFDEMNVDWLGLCEYSADFTSDKSVKTASAILSRYDVSSVGPQESYQWNAAFARPRFEIVEAVTNFYLRHNQNCYYLAHRVVIDDAEEAWFVQTHLGWEDEAIRAEQIRELIAAFEGCPRVVISGDFNVSTHDVSGASRTKWADVARFTSAGYAVADTTLGGTAGATLSCVIDNIFVRGFALENPVVHAVNGLSDHQALSCTLRPFIAGEVQMPAPPPPLYYTGNTLAPIIAVDPGSVVTVAGTPRDVGDYAVTVALADPATTRWTDGSTTNLSYTLTILKAANGWTKKPSLSKVRWTRGETSGVLNLGTSAFGTTVASMTQAQIDACGEGEWTVTLSIEGSANYGGASMTLPFHVFEPVTCTLNAEGGLSADLMFGSAAEARPLYVAWGGVDAGEDIDAWEHVQEAATVPANATSITGVALPEGVGTQYGSVRFFIRTACDSLDYVQEGLIGHWDARENIGRYVHGSNASYWTNLVGGASFKKPSTGWTVFDDHLKLEKTSANANNPSIALSALDTFTAKTVEVVCRTDGDFDFTHSGRVDVINLGNDGAIGFRGQDNYIIVGIFVNDADRTAFYTVNTSSPHNSPSSATTLASYSLSLNPNASKSSLHVNGDVFIQGTGTSYYNTKFDHNNKISFGLTRGREYISSIRLYNRVLTDAERRRNLAVDQSRYTGGRGHLSASPLVMVPVPFTVETSKTGGVPTGATLRFTPANAARAVYFAPARKDYGEEAGKWPTLTRLGTDVPAGCSVVDVALPAGLDHGGFRFFLLPAEKSSSYVQDGLVAQWDALENAGTGVHDASITTWKDLVGSCDFDLSVRKVEFGADLVKIPTGSSVISVAMAELATATNKTVEIVCRSDEGFDATQAGRVDLINLGNDCAVSYRGSGGYMILGVFVNPADRQAYYTFNAGSPFNTATQIRTLTSYSLVWDAGNYSGNSSLRVNDTAFVTGVKWNPNNFYWNADFPGNANASIGFNRANEYIATIRVYNRLLTAAERTANYRIDDARFLRPVSTDVSPYVAVTSGTLIIFR